jgi:hypothetical protein
MALTLNKVPEFKTLSGVYQGQTDPIEIGTIAANVGPNFIGFYPGDDSIQMNAFFDPSVSVAISRVLERQTDGIIAYPKIGYIHLGQFRINNFPLQVSLHDNTLSYPQTNNFFSDYPPTYWWIDIGERDSNNELITTPFYPYWALTDDAHYDPDELYKYPQDYGGVTKFPLTGMSPDDFRCAYMTTDVSLGRGTMPSKSEVEVLNATPLSEFNYRPSDLLSETYKNSSATDIANAFGPTGAKLIPGISPAHKVTSLISEDKKRFYLSYTASVFGRGGRKFTIPLIMMIFEDPKNIGKLAIADITDYVNMVREELAAENIDLYKLDQNIAQAQRFDLKLKDKSSIFLSYHFTAFPCAIISSTDQRVYTHIFEGFNWGMTREYKRDSGWENVQLIPPSATQSTAEPNYFMTTLWRYYGKLKNNKRFQTPIHDPLLFN